MKRYEDITGFVSLEELEETTKVDEISGGGITALLCAAVGFGAAALSAVACPSGACSGHC